MSPRERITAALLPALQRVFPGAGASDITFFGAYADVSSPLPRKYGVDISETAVYNIRDEVCLGGRALFSEAWVSGGFINFGISEEAFLSLCEGLGNAPSSPAEVIGLSPCGVDYAVARLLDTANERPDAPFSLGRRFSSVRLSFRMAVFCDSPASRNLAADACLKALALDRRERLLGRRPALFMAAALYNIERQTF